MSGSVFVTGIGIISAIGNNTEETLQSLIYSRSGIGKLNQFKTRHSDSVSVGEVPENNRELRLRAAVTGDTLYTRTSLLGIIAASEAGRHANIAPDKRFRTGLVSATSVGGMGVAEDHFTEYIGEGANNEWLPWVNTLDCSDSTERIADHLKILEHITTISTACSSSANAIMYAARLIRHGIVDRVVAGGTDSLSRFTVNGFMSLKILDPSPCKPFDANRAGLNLGEGAGYLVLESERAAKGKNVLCELAGYANFNDAFHQTASSPEGTAAFRAMRKTLEMAGCIVSEVDYINAHGTGTEINDMSEGNAMRQLFGAGVPPFSSTKSFTGHTLAAAGGVEAVISVLALKHGMLFPNLNFKTPMPDPELSPVTEAETGKSIRTVLSNSFGFGGNTSSLLFRKP
jgi:3-oxoacyl-[acyl-carrier-protein] synthase-1